MWYDEFLSEDRNRDPVQVRRIEHIIDAYRFRLINSLCLGTVFIIEVIVVAVLQRSRNLDFRHVDIKVGNL